MDSGANRREFAHSNNPGFACAPDVILIPFGRQSYLQRAAETYGGQRVALDESTDRIVYQLTGPPAPGDARLLGDGRPGGRQRARDGPGQRCASGRYRRGLRWCRSSRRGRPTGGRLGSSARRRGTSRYYAAGGVPRRLRSAPHPSSLAIWRGSSAMRAHTAASCSTTDASYRQGPEVYERVRRACSWASRASAPRPTVVARRRRPGPGYGSLLLRQRQGAGAAEDQRLSWPRRTAYPSRLFTAALEAAATALTDRHRRIGRSDDRATDHHRKISVR